MRRTARVINKSKIKDIYSGTGLSLTGFLN
jgi:hypothetical protein